MTVLLIVLVVILILVIAATLRQLPEIRRYLKLRSM